MILLTEVAAEKLGELIDQEEESGVMLRVAVRPGGCSGFSYEMFFDTEKEDSDVTKDYGKVTVVSDPSSATLLNGATLDHKGGLQGGFSIDNPNAQRTCGCGSSFS